MPEPIKYFEYRNLKLPIYLDDVGQEFWTVIDDEEVGFGSFNTEYEEDLKYLIDSKLDFICNFKDFPGAKLCWFQNGYNNSDIELVYKSRVLKVFLVTNKAEITEISLNKIKEESIDILSRLLSHEVTA